MTRKSFKVCYLTEKLNQSEDGKILACKEGCSGKLYYKEKLNRKDANENKDNSFKEIVGEYINENESHVDDLDLMTSMNGWLRSSQSQPLIFYLLCL